LLQTPLNLKAATLFAGVCIFTRSLQHYLPAGLVCNAPFLGPAREILMAIVALISPLHGVLREWRVI